MGRRPGFGTELSMASVLAGFQGESGRDACVYVHTYIHTFIHTLIHVCACVSVRIYASLFLHLCHSVHQHRRKAPPDLVGLVHIRNFKCKSKDCCSSLTVEECTRSLSKVILLKWKLAEHTQHIHPRQFRLAFNCSL